MQPSGFLGGAPGSMAAPPEGAFAAIAGAGSGSVRAWKWTYFLCLKRGGGRKWISVLCCQLHPVQFQGELPQGTPDAGAPGGAGDGREPNANTAMVMGAYQKEALAEYRMRLLNGELRCPCVCVCV
eukprot:1156945-Pelagomonas_calceolata.AAC.7